MPIYQIERPNGIVKRIHTNREGRRISTDIFQKPAQINDEIIEGSFELVNGQSDIIPSSSRSHILEQVHALTTSVHNMALGKREASQTKFGQSLERLFDNLNNPPVRVEKRTITTHQTPSQGLGIIRTFLGRDRDGGVPQNTDSVTREVIRDPKLPRFAEIRSVTNPTGGRMKAITPSQIELSSQANVSSHVHQDPSGNFDIDLSVSSEEGGGASVTGPGYYEAEITDGGSFDSFTIRY